MPMMNVFDVFSLVLLGLSCLMGFVRGLTQEVLGLLSLLGAVLCTISILPYAQPYLVSYIESELVRDIVIASVVFCVTLTLLKMATNAVSQSMKAGPLGGVDRILGLGFGALRVWTGAGMIYLVAAALVSPDHFPVAVRQAFVTPLMAHSADVVRTWLPDYVLRGLQNEEETQQHEAVLHKIESVSAVLAHPLPEGFSPAHPGPVMRRLTDIAGV